MVRHVEVYVVVFFCFKQKPGDEVRISDCSSDVCSSDLGTPLGTSLSALELGCDSSACEVTPWNRRGFSATHVTAIRLTEPIAAMAMITPRLNRIARGGRLRIASVSGSSLGGAAAGEAPLTSTSLTTDYPGCWCRPFG